jgi:NADPH:quinone reductase
MKALLCTEFGPPEKLVIREIDAPTPLAHEVVMKVAFAGLNFFDTLIIENKYQLKPPPPFSPAAEASGVIVALGADVKGFAVGDRVVSTSGFGAAREMLAVDYRQVAKVPDGLSLEKAAGLLITYGTSMHALKQRGELKQGETLCILGASGGVGLAALEIGKAMGATVIACCSTDDKVDFCLKLGADAGINYTSQDYREEVKRITGGKGTDVLYDPVGDKWAEPAVRSMAWKGRYLVVGFAGGDIPKIPLNLLLLKGCDLRGVYWGEFTKREPLLHAENVTQLLSWAMQGKISAHIDKIYPLEEAVMALNDLKNRKVKGKALLRL